MLQRSQARGLARFHAASSPARHGRAALERPSWPEAEKGHCLAEAVGGHIVAVGDVGAGHLLGHD